MTTDSALTDMWAASDSLGVDQVGVGAEVVELGVGEMPGVVDTPGVLVGEVAAGVVGDVVGALGEGVVVGGVVVAVVGVAAVAGASRAVALDVLTTTGPCPESDTTGGGGGRTTK